MKNIHVLPTDKPSRLFKFANQLHLDTIPKDYYKKYNIYITSDEEIKVNDYITDGYRAWKWKDDSSLLGRKKIILTTDQDLIDDGVQSIDNKFLKWFVKNSSCEYVETVKVPYHDGSGYSYLLGIPQEEPKQETLEDLLNKKANQSSRVDLDAYANGLDDGAKWQAERMYSEEEVIAIVEKSRETGLTAEFLLLTEQFKKK